MALVIKTADIKGFAAGTHATVAAVDTVTTGLRYVKHAVAHFSSDPVATDLYVTCAPANQTTAPGSIVIKTWMPTAAGNTAPTAGVGGFGMDVEWMAVGH